VQEKAASKSIGKLSKRHALLQTRETIDIAALIAMKLA
jgi:hypothetical protein